MSEAKPRKRRLVHKQEYLDSQWAKGFGYSLSVTFGVGGLVFLVMAVAVTGLGLLHFSKPDQTNYTILSVFFGGFGLTAMWFGKILFRSANHIEPVVLITKHNANQLPDAETLVRGSDCPAVDQHAELLRAAQHGPQTPADQLLRATKTNKQD